MCVGENVRHRGAARGSRDCSLFSEGPIVTVPSPVRLSLRCKSGVSGKFTASVRSSTLVGIGSGRLDTHFNRSFPSYLLATLAHVPVKHRTRYLSQPTWHSGEDGIRDPLRHISCRNMNPIPPEPKVRKLGTRCT